MAGNLSRRRVLKSVAGAGVIGIAGCTGNGGSNGDTPGTDGGTTTGGGVQTVTIGNLNPTSGPYGFFGNQNVAGLQQRVKEFNESDEVLQNVELEIVTRDTEGKPDVGNQAARELTLQENVDLLSGTVSSSVSASVLSIASSENVPFFMTASTDYSLTTGENCERVGFRWTPHSRQIARPVAEWSVNNLGGEGYILVEDYAYGNSLNEAFTQTVDDQGGSIAGRSIIEFGSQDFQAVIEDAKSIDPDWLFIGIVGGTATAFLQQAANRGFDIPITSQYLISPVLGQLPPEQFDKLPSVTTLASDPGTADIGSNQSFRQRWMESHETPPLPNHYIGYNAATFVGQVLDEAPEISTDAIVNTAEGFTVDALFGEVPVRACDHQAGINMWIAEATAIDPETGLATFEYIDRLNMANYLAPCDEIPCQLS